MNRCLERAAPLLVVLLLAGLLAACGGSPGGPGTLEGRVVNAAGRAQPGVTVEVYALRTAGAVGEGGLYQKGVVLQEQSAGDGGRFSFVLEPGRYIVQVSQDGAAGESRMVEIEAGRTLRVELQLGGSSRGAVYMARMFSRGVSA